MSVIRPGARERAISTLLPSFDISITSTAAASWL